MGKTIGIVSLKGGVGKTTIAAALAADLVHYRDKRVLLVDANYSAPNVGMHMNVPMADQSVHNVLNGSRPSSAIYTSYGIDVMPGNFLYEHVVNPLKLRTKLTHLKNDYDFVVIDSSPTLNEELLSTLYASDILFCVATPDFPTLSCVMKLAKVANHYDRPLSGVIVNRITNPHLQVSLAEIQESTGLPVVSMIPEDYLVLESLFARAPAPIYDKHSAFSKHIAKLSKTIIGEKEKRSLLKKFFLLDFGSDEVNRELLRQHFYTSIFKE